VSNDIFARIYADNIHKIVTTIANIVKALNGCLAKRSSNPIAGPDILLRYNQEAAKMKESTLSTLTTIVFAFKFLFLFLYLTSDFLIKAMVKEAGKA
jgi:hypothetical protein